MYITTKELEENFQEFIADAKKFEENGNKSAARRARINSIQLRESLKTWRKDVLIQQAAVLEED